MRTDGKSPPSTPPYGFLVECWTRGQYPLWANRRCQIKFTLIQMSRLAVFGRLSVRDVGLNRDGQGILDMACSRQLWMTDLSAAATATLEAPRKATRRVH